MTILKFALVSASIAMSSASLAEDFQLTSTDISAGEHMSQTHEFTGFGCNGNNLSPQLSWSGAPEATQAYAVFAYDPDAPTGSGWWHWQLINIPASITTLQTGQSEMPTGSQQQRNDYGQNAFGGACPPEGHGPHRYQFTVYALPSVLDIPQDASAALTGFMVKANAIGEASLEALYQR